MNRSINIFIKVTLLITCLLGWSGNMWAMTDIISSPAPADGMFSNDTHWYTIVYRGANNPGTYLNVNQHTNNELTWGSNSLDEGAYWCFVGDNTNGYKMYNLKTGASMVLQAVNTSQNAHVKMVNATNADANLSTFTTGPMIAGGKTAYNYIRRGLTGQAGFNNNGSYVAMYIHPSNLANGANFAVELKEVTPPRIGNAKLVFQDVHGNKLNGVSVQYGSSVTINSSMSTYDFGNVVYSSSYFHPTSDAYTLSTTFNTATNTLTFTLTQDPNSLVFSSEPSATGWNADTRWYTMRNNRENISTEWQFKYLTTTENGTRDDLSLYIRNLGRNVPPTDRGGYWCFVGNNTEGFHIQNMAYGPDFYLAYLGSNKYTMVHKDQIPSGAVVLFTYNDQSNFKGGGSKSYIFRIGTSGYNHIHINNSDLIAWNPGSWQLNDSGSSFLLNLASTDDYASMPELDIYKVDITGAQLTYTGSRNVFGKRRTSPFIILEKGGAEVSLSDISTGGFSLSNFNVAQPSSTTYMKIISADVAIALTQPKWYYIQNYNGNAYLSTGNGYLLADGAIALSNTTKPSDYQGLWMEIPTGTFDADGNGITYLVNAYSGDTKVLAFTGADGNAKAKMYTLDELPADAKLFFERRFYTGHNGSFYYREPNTNNYWNKRTDGGAHLAFWNSDRAYGESGSRYAHSEVANLPDNVTIHFEKEDEGIEIPANLKVIYESLDRYRMVDGVSTLKEGASNELTDGMKFDFDNVPFLVSLFTTNNGEYLVKGVRVENGQVYLIIGQLPRIVHRQHAVFDHLHSVAQRPNNKFIQDGDGMIPHPYAKDFTEANGYKENDRVMQNTSVFHVTQYTKPGSRTECILPFTKSKGTGDHMRQYQRWYNYKTERPLDDVIIRLDNGNSTLGNFNMFANGHCNYNSSGSRQYDVLGKADIKLPFGSKEIYVGVDASEFQDARALVNGDIEEPSLNMRVVYHIISAHEMAKKLTTKDSDDKWWEAKEYFVPNIKRGSDTYKNNADLIPLDMPFSNYWIYKTLDNTDDSNLMPIVPESGNYSTLRNNLEIVVDGTATDNRPMTDYLDVDIFEGNPGNIGSAPYINGNHFLYYKVKGNGATRTIPAGSQAIIKVYAKDGNNGSSPKYQLLKFTLHFQGATEPLAITSVVGNPTSTRSVDYFLKNDFKESASLTFQNKEVAFSKIPGWRNDGNESVTYAFPIDFKRTSYGYSPSNTFGNYRITTKGYGIQYRPVALYEHNIKNSTSTTMECPDDYFFYIDAAESPGQVASITLDGTLCVGSRLFCYGWVGSSNRYNESGAGASVLLQVVGRRHDGTEEVIASYLPGTLTDVSYDENGNLMRSLSYACTPSTQQAGWMNLDATQVGVWNSVGFSFVVKDVSFDSYDLRIINNCFSTAGGDYVLDDFRVFVSPPKGNVDFTTPLCSDALRHVKVHTDFDMLLEAAGVNETVAGNTVPVSFCFLNKKIYDEATKKYYDVDEQGNRTLKPGVDDTDETTKSDFNKAFGDALIGVRSIDKTVKGHAFHNFTVPVNFDSIPAYSYNESPDDQIFKEEKDNGERRIVFKEQLYQSSGAAHNWVPGESYYLLFAPFHVQQDHVDHSDVGTSTFDIASLCCVLTTFDIMPPIEVKGDATVTSSDQVKACDNQIITFKVDMPALKLNEDETETTDAVIRGLNYDWWVGTSKTDATHAGFLAAKYGTYATVENARRYNHQAVDDYPDEKDVKMDVYLASSLENVRFYFPEARSLDEVTLVPYSKDNGYGVVQEHIDCIRHFMQVDENGRKPLSLFGQTFNLKVSHAEADANNKQHFVAIPIIPEQQYSVDEKLIYCPAPQELIIHVAATAPNINNGFASMPYPTHIENVPVRIGLGQAKAITKAATTASPGNTLNVPLRNITVTGSTSTRLIPTEYGTEPFGPIYLTATDDTTYTFAQEGDFKMRRVAQVIDIVAEKGAESGYMKVAFTTDFTMREGFTYTLKLPYIEDKACECEGTLVFDVKVVPEYQVWTGEHGSDWTNDKNWCRADRDILYAGNAASDGTQPLADYPSNEANKTDGSFVPMYFTNVMVDNAPKAVASLYNIIPASLSTRTFLAGLQATATTGIIYDLETSRPDESGNYQCELFGTYVANGITFTPQSQLMNAHLLSYNKAWVEYLLDCDRWYTVSSPLQQTYSGEWYAPTKGYSQQTPHFYPITYNTILNNRFDPAFYQRSWDKAKADVYRMPGDGLLLTENPHNVAVKFDWSNVYNDVRVAYSNGGFSVKPIIGNSKATETSVLVRMPKDDNSYEYYNHAGSYHGDLTSIAHTEGQHHRLISDMLKDAETFSQTLTNNTADNRFFLVGNPFVASLNMDEFFRLNPHLQQKFWIMEADLQAVSVKTDDNNWHTTSSTATVAPGQGFFVVLKESAPATGSTEITFSRSMQAVTTTPLLQSAQNNITITATYEGRTESSAIITFSDAASRDYVATEDAETLIDSNTSEEASTVFTLAGNNAVTVNATKADIQRIPLCLIAPEDKETTLTFTGAEGYYLYDNDEDASMPISSDTEVVVNGSSIGRYFITAKPIDDSMKDKLHEEEGDTYNLAGIRLASPRKGIVIRGGKKIYYE